MDSLSSPLLSCVIIYNIDRSKVAGLERWKPNGKENEQVISLHDLKELLHTHIALLQP